MSPGQGDPASSQPPEQRVSFYPAWCKRCGNCAAFCPRQALGHDEWGYPMLAHPERCTACGLCEMLCPDFAISVGGAPPTPAEAKPAAEEGRPSSAPSPERLAPAPGDDEKNGG